MAPEPSSRTRRHRSQTRGQSRPRPKEPHSPFGDPTPPPAQRRPHDRGRHPSSPTGERTDTRGRRKQDTPLRSKSRPPGSGPEAARGKGSGKRPRVRFSTVELDGAAQAVTSKGTCSGFLRKQADNEPGAWNEYFFVVKPLTYLFYYKSKDDETPRGIIDLEYLTDVKRNADCLQRAVGGGDHCFRVSGKLPSLTAEQLAGGDVPKMRPLYLDTEDDDKAKQWMTAIRNHRFSLKKEEQVLDMVSQLRDARLRISQLEETQARETEMKRSLRIKAKTLLHKMRAVDSGNTDDLPEVELDVDDTADDMLAMLEGMEDVLVNLHAKLEEQKQTKADKAATTSSRRGFTQVLQRAVSRRETTSLSEISEDEETLAAIRSRRQRNAVGQPPVIKEEPNGKGREYPVEKLQEKPEEKLNEKMKETFQEKSKEKMKEKPLEELLPPSLDNVSDLLAMWKAKKKNSSLTKPEDVEEDGARKNNSNSSSGRGVTVTPETGSARKRTAIQKSHDSEALSEEDTASLNSTEDHDSGEKLPPGWTKHESRGYPGTYYYANEDGKVSWDVPTDDMAGQKDDSNDHCGEQSDLEDEATDRYDHPSGHNDPDDEAAICPDIISSVDTSTESLSENETDEQTAGGTTSAAYRKQKPKPKSAWAFKLPKLLPTTTLNTQLAVPEVAAASLSPIRHGANHHEF